MEVDSSSESNGVTSFFMLTPSLAAIGEKPSVQVSHLSMMLLKLLEMARKLQES